MRSSCQFWQIGRGPPSPTSSQHEETLSSWRMLGEVRRVPFQFWARVLGSRTPLASPLVARCWWKGGAGRRGDPSTAGGREQGASG